MRAKATMIAVLAGGMFTLAGCAQPVGDLGRSRPSGLGSQIAPRIERVITSVKGGKTSNLLYADEERVMQDRVWRFFRSPHAADWSYSGRIEISRATLLSDTAFERDTSRYYEYLRKQNFSSSHTRYRAVQSDAEADIAMVPEVFDAICAVQELDRRRATASGALNELDPSYRRDVDLRIEENRANAEIFARALEFRLASYSFALKRLLLDTPHPEAQALDATLSELATASSTASGGDFCLSAQFHNSDAAISGALSR